MSARAARKSSALLLAPALLTIIAGGCGPSRSSEFAGFVDVPVAAVAVQVAGQVASVGAQEGDRVHKGQLLAQLDSRERAAMLTQAEANLARTQDALSEAEKNTAAIVPTVRGAEADVDRVRADLEDARLNYERTQRLVQSGAAPAQQLDSARARYLEAQATLTGMGASHSATRGRVNASQAAVVTAHSSLRAAQAALELAKVQLAQTEVRSPFEGLVVDQNLQPGEWAAPGTPVLTVEDLSRQWVRIDVEETTMAPLRLGQPAQIRVIAFPGKTYAGHIIQIGAEGEFALNRDVRRGRPDIRTFRVRVGLDQIAEELRPGMTAEVELRR